MELLAYLIGLAFSLFFSLPVSLQVGVLVAIGWMWRYRQGWNNAVNADYGDDMAKARARRNARLR